MTAVPDSPSASPSAVPVVASVRPPPMPEIPKLTQPEELANAFSAMPTADGWIALATKDGSDEAKSQPVTLLSASRGKIERVELPFSMAGDLKGSPRLFAENLAARRFLFQEGDLPKLRLRVWDGATKEAAFEGWFPLVGGAALSRTQALAVTGKMDARGWVEWANGTTAALFREGSWRKIDLPGPAERNWFDCKWDVAAAPDADDFILLQFCTAPKRQFAYAVFRLAADATAIERISFDNELFRTPGTERGTFEVEDDGTIDVGSDVGASEGGTMDVARLRGGKEPWEVVHVEMPTRLLSSSALSGDHVLFTNGGTDTRESHDGGKTFEPAAPLSGGMFQRANRFGAAFHVFGGPKSSGQMFIRRW